MDFLAIGDITVDAFIKLSDAWIETDNPKKTQELCMRFGEKLPYESLTEVAGVGNAPNAAVAAARLGLISALVSNLGADDNGQKCLAVLAAEGVDSEHIHMHRGERTNYHFVLSLGAERTILVKHESYPYAFPSPEPPPRWAYLSSLGAETHAYHAEIADWLAEHPDTQLAFQPGSFQISASGTEVMKKLYARAAVVVCNREEAEEICALRASATPDVGGFKHRVFSARSATENLRVPRDTSRIRVLLTALHALGPKIICITDGPQGAYMSAPEGIYFMPPYPDPKPPVNRTGAGDAFAATFVSYLARGLSPVEALRRAPINSAFVVQEIGAQKGLLTREQLEEKLAAAPQAYTPQEI